jgi:hypothetical protein
VISLHCVCLFLCCVVPVQAEALRRADPPSKESYQMSKYIDKVWWWWWWWWCVCVCVCVVFVLFLLHLSVCSVSLWLISHPIVAITNLRIRGMCVRACVCKRRLCEHCNELADYIKERKFIDWVSFSFSRRTLLHSFS